MTDKEKIAIMQHELDLIHDESFRVVIQKHVGALPDYFFDVAASSTGKYHPSYALGSGGLVRHTKAAVAFAEELSKLEMYHFTDADHDIAVAALILHDGYKHGLEESASRFTTFDHPLVAAEIIHDAADETEDEIIQGMLHLTSACIFSHMGEFTRDRSGKEILPKPLTKIQKFVHLCDYLASRKWLDVDFGDNLYEGVAK